jgi:threonyl-tRNA synthetase
MSNEQLSHLRHSCAHLLAAAVGELYPQAKRTIGPAIENGFYYDFDFSAYATASADKGDKFTVSEKDFLKIEEKMQDLVKGWNNFERKEVSALEAKEFFKDNPYKVELIEEFSKDGQTLTLYTSGNFTDLCRGGHADKPSEDLKNFKLLSVAGAYWRGDEKNKMLTRIYGTCFATSEELDAYLKQQEEAKKRDHRKLGKELELFTIIDEIGPGLPLFYPKGAILRRTIENLIQEIQEKHGFVPIWIPHITKGKLYEISGHLDKYDAMYAPMKIDEDDYYLKPMNCPHFMMLYKTLPHSYRDLPLRYTCTTTNYRYEKSGELSGLTRVRALTQDDCHVFCEPEKIHDEIKVMLEMIDELYSSFGLKDFYVRISLRDSQHKEKYLGTDQVWETAENALRTIVKATGWQYKEAEDEAAFYGPKLDFMFKDAIGREWQLSTIQLDFQLPERFELEYTNNQGVKSRPVVIHRAMLGSVERFMGIMIEHFAGAFPAWLAPVQIQFAPVSAKHVEAVNRIAEEFRSAGVRVVIDDADETIGNKVRKAVGQKIPYIVVLGDRDLSGEAWTIKVRGQEEQLKMSKEEFKDKVLRETRERAL